MHKKQRQLQHNPSCCSCCCCCWGAYLRRARTPGAGKSLPLGSSVRRGRQNLHKKAIRGAFFHQKYKKTVPTSSSECVFLAAIVPLGAGRSCHHTLHPAEGGKFCTKPSKAHFFTGKRRRRRHLPVRLSACLSACFSPCACAPTSLERAIFFKKTS